MSLKTNRNRHLEKKQKKTNKSSQKKPKWSFCLRFPLSGTVTDWLPSGALCAFSLCLTSSLLLYLCSPSSVWGGLCVSWRDAAANSGNLVVCCALSMLSRAQRLLGLSPSWCWALCSHELWLLHRLLVCGWIPWGVAGNVRSGRAHWSLHGGRRAPDRCHRGRTTGKSTAGGQSVAVDRTTALLHQLLEFGSFILKPNFYLQIFFFFLKRDIKIYVNIYNHFTRFYAREKWKAKHDNKKYKLSLLINNTK